MSQLVNRNRGQSTGMFSEWKNRKQGYEPLNKHMNVFQFRTEHVKRLLVIIVIVALILFYKWPWSRSRTIPDISHVKGVYKSDSSLHFKNREFYLGDRQFKIISGAMHYFRVVPEYWKDRMLKMKACGLNTLETYVPWNLHEEIPGKFNFGGMLDLHKYLQLAQQLGLYVILRPGPYICSEWDFGGLPAWLLRDPNMAVRSTYPPYQKAVENYFSVLIPYVASYQYSEGGPIIAVQIENEFGQYSDRVEHLHFLKTTLQRYGIKEMLMTSDGWNSNHRLGQAVAPFHADALPTANFMEYEQGSQILDFIAGLSSDFPLFVMEFWDGWFDHWGSHHGAVKTSVVADNLKKILQRGASVNFYMFHGGTNFGFMAGANYFDSSGYEPDVTSYDYDAPLSEAGDIRPKFKAIRDLLIKYKYINSYTEEGTVPVKAYLSFDDMLLKVNGQQKSKHLLTMEELKLDENIGQSFGYILYRAKIPKTNSLIFTSPPKDRLLVFVNGIQMAVLDWKSKSYRVDLSQTLMYDEINTLDLLVENLGRVNYVAEGSKKMNSERKGLQGEVLLGGSGEVRNWKIYPLGFKTEYLNRVAVYEKWKPSSKTNPVPGMFRAEFFINQRPTDTFLSMTGWEKGVVFINNFNLGRYWNIGPQKTLYIPAPLLKKGDNQILIFEEHKAGNSVELVDVSELG